MAKKSQSLFICQNCSYQTTKWMGRCPECGEWNSFEESVESNSLSATQTVSGRAVASSPQKVKDIDSVQFDRIATGINEFDRVVGGGLTRGSLTLIGGEPGVGKSTLLTAVLGKISNIVKNNILYVSGEESASQVADRAKRIGINQENVYVLHETLWQNILAHMKAMRPECVVIDSIQTTVSGDLQSPPGTVSQIREVTYELMNYVKANGVTCFIIGHITKDGAIAGPKILEHMVDTVIYFEGDQFGHYRLLRSIKNRFGNTNEVGIFEMSDRGLLEVNNPSQYFLDERLSGSYGRSLTCILEGSRCLFVEIQALVVENKFGNGRRTTQGIDQNRLSMLVAVIEKYFGIPLGLNDIYLNVVGGIRLDSRESDLSVIASLLSSFRGNPIADDTVFIGEIGLTGEVRSVPRIEQRLKEISQLNYKRVITSYKAAKQFEGKFSVEILGIRRAQEIDKLL
ncbi:MAG: DNA repair protein RadA [Bdellovibrionales bacterium RIFOXYD12_FULL_39_22]|nr:MAG: DNA repair protein RadA [Bdellovibrionales bacterium RIFOXYB1_FULL_39_21]OFZ45179.1 MAG: DNA repair protein RadA [Bdellovibrionales bacterium RIFOXYC12_FULL_39_17]OFZ45629.1 MAG: DNA repair protein RadA [Bdellovibrionales bacterium RIFOXYC1_FULL_39_130]OFZ77491.1 MAG: DNA repair protein RadA [Bdellovibrionales bacterium RIFOXYD1_FULL_39_84]OFZ91620.1 MAG: DNA repair protein RadA [Bdellovibrionales bacterium RIFOXYD12_FULL_39_22]HLE11918.1 DNA repair protein RadA [Bacteriovoracaceae bac